MPSTIIIKQWVHDKKDETTPHSTPEKVKMENKPVGGGGRGTRIVHGRTVVLDKSKKNYLFFTVIYNLVLKYNRSYDYSHA